MKKWLLAALALLFLVFLSGCAPDARRRPTELEQLEAAVLAADREAGREIAQQRNARIRQSGAEEREIDFDELLLLARFLDAAAGGPDVSEELRLCTGEVVLNRAASPEFPDTLEGVLSERGRFPPSQRPEALEGRIPSRESAQAALSLLLGRRMLSGRVVYLGARRFGGGVYAAFCDRKQRFTYFCLTEHPELYAPDGDAPDLVDVPERIG